MSVTKSGFNHEYEYLSGKCRWAKLFQPSQYGKYSLDLNLDQESLGKVLELKKRGAKNVLKNDEGEYWITLSSPAQIDTKNGPRVMEKPTIVNKDGSPWNMEIGVGNGSDVTCKLWIRKYKPPRQDKEAIALRLTGVKIDNLVPFNPRVDFEDDRKRVQTEGLAEQTRKPW